MTHLQEPSGNSPSRTAGNASSTAIRSSVQDISHLHWRYSAARIETSQQKIHARLCTNCGGQKFFVETAGKMEKNAFPVGVGLAYRNPDEL
jgi:hypothetical protein